MNTRGFPEMGNPLVYTAFFTTKLLLHKEAC